MSKAAKKTKTTEIKPTKKVLPEVKGNELTFVLNVDEVLSLIQILSFSKELFMQMSINAAGQENKQDQVTFATRSEVSAYLCHRFKEIASIGEPTSRDLH